MKAVNPIALAHARVVNDKNADPFKRAVSALSLSHLANGNEIFIDVPDDHNISVRTTDVVEAFVDNKSIKYIWRNGARVKVKA